MADFTAQSRPSQEAARRLSGVKTNGKGGGEKRLDLSHKERKRRDQGGKKSRKKGKKNNSPSAPPSRRLTGREVKQLQGPLRLIRGKGLRKGIQKEGLAARRKTFLSLHV